MGQSFHDRDSQRESPSGKHWQEIPLVGGGETLVSAQDVALVSEHRWRAGRVDGTTYAQTTIAGKTVRMHRLLLGLTDRRIVVDHINRNGLDNRRENIRAVTQAENNLNRPKLRGGACKTGKGWIARVQRGGVSEYLGFFRDEESARAAYETRAREIHGEFFCL